MSTAVVKEIEQRIKDDMIRFRASRSWVIASGMAAIYNVDIVSCWEESKKRRQHKFRLVK